MVVLIRGYLVVFACFLGVLGCFGRTPPQEVTCRNGGFPRPGSCGAIDSDVGERTDDPLDGQTDAGESSDAEPTPESGIVDASMLGPVRVDPQPIQFGIVRVGSVKTEQLTFRNQGTARSIRLSLSDEASELSLNQQSFFLSAGGMASVQLFLRAGEGTSIRASMVVESCGGNCPQTIPIAGSKVPTGVLCMPLDAGPLSAGTCAEQQISCQSRVDQQVAFEPGRLLPPLNGQLLNDRFVIQPREAFSLSVRICAPEARSYAGSLQSELQYPGAVIEDLRVAVAYEGVTVMPPTCAVEVPRTVDFGRTQVGRSTDQLVQVRNVGRAACRFTSARLGGGNSGEFEVRSSGQFQVAPGDSSSVRLRFTPTSPGRKSTEFRVDSTDPTQRLIRIGLEGEGLSTSPATRFDIVRTNTSGPTFPAGRTLSFSNSDDGFAREPLPFAFNFLGTSVTEVFVSTNGFVAFDQRGVGSPRNTAIPMSSNPNSIIAWFWDDLILDGPSSRVTAFLAGTQPNRRFVLSFLAIRKFRGGGVVNADTELNALLELHEGTNEIVVHYGSSVSRQAASDFDATLGWENANGSSGGSPLRCGSGCGLSDWPVNARIRYVPR